MRVPFGTQQLKRTTTQLCSLKGNEPKIINDVLSELEAPIDRRKIRACGQRIHEKISRLGADEWEEIVSLILQLLSIRDFLLFLEDFEVIGEQGPGPSQIKDVLNLFRVNKSLARVVATDQFLEQGPRLQSMNWFCDIRTCFPADTGEAPNGDVFREEIKIPIAIIQIKVDESYSPVYFQLTESELEWHISRLQKALSQLRDLAGRERKP
jgi:hypothetical protein